MMNDYPPGHPAGTDEFISIGEVTSGHGLGTAGVLGTRARATGAPALAIDTMAETSAPVGPNVLIAVDGTSISDRVVRTAHRLFGEAATYMAINVGRGPYSSMSWAYVWPVGGPSTWISPSLLAEAFDGEVDGALAEAEAHAAAVTNEAGLAQAKPIGDVGDPTTAIIAAAHHHGADVVVIGADVRHWLSHLLDGSVERELLREADFAVLVVAAEGHAAGAVGS